MDWNTIFGFIETKLLIVVAACWVIGFVLKRTPKIPDWSIVYIVTISSLLMATGLLGWSVETLIQGLLCGAFAVYGHQVVKQAPGRDHNE